MKKLILTFAWIPLGLVAQCLTILLVFFVLTIYLEQPAKNLEHYLYRTKIKTSKSFVQTQIEPKFNQVNLNISDYPNGFDQSPLNECCQNCFENLFDGHGITTCDWTKVNQWTYVPSFSPLEKKVRSILIWLGNHQVGPGWYLTFVTLEDGTLWYKWTTP